MQILTQDRFGLRMQGMGRLLVIASAGLIAAAALTGCQSSEGMRTGMSLADAGHAQVEVGDRTPDFAFVADDESLTRFHEIRGRVTVLAFPDDPEWPNCASCRQLANIAAEKSQVRINVMAVSVAGPHKPCHEALPSVERCEVDADHLVAICDRRGEIRHIYGADVDGKYFVINNHGKVVAAGKLGDWEQLAEDVKCAVWRVADEECGPESEI